MEGIKILKLYPNFICKKLNMELVDGMGDKIQSSSWLLNSNNEN